MSEKIELDRTQFEEHCLRRFLFTQSFEIYGGVAGLYDFGPVLCSIKENVIQQWRNQFILADNALEIDCAYLTPEPVFIASGHVAKFADLMVQDVKTLDYYRADKVIKSNFEEIIDNFEKEKEDKSAAKKNKKSKCTKLTVIDETVIKEMRQVLAELDGYKQEEIDGVIRKFQVTAPETGNDLTASKPFNLMFSTQIGPTGKQLGYFRPETAQGIFTNFKRCLDYNGGQMPVSVATYGRAYRNEISPRAGLLRLREFLLAEIEHFMNPKDGIKVHPKFDEVKDIKLPFFSRENQEGEKGIEIMTINEAINERHLLKNYTLAYFIGKTYKFLCSVGIKPQFIRFRQHLKTEMAHYASDCWDAEILTSYGWIECVGHADRSCFDLSKHMEATKVDLTVFQSYSQDEIKIEKQFEPNFDKKLMGKELKKYSQFVVEIIEKASQEQKKQWKNELELNGKFKLSDVKIPEDKKKKQLAEQSDIIVTSDMLKFNEIDKKITGESFIPSVIEPAFGISRIIYCILEHSFWIRNNSNNSNNNEEEKESKDSEKKLNRIVFSFPPAVAPYKAAVLPLSFQKEFMPSINKLTSMLVQKSISHKVDTSGSAIGKKYARLDDIGIPFAITLDFDTMKNDSVTLRDRDTCTQIRAPMNEVVDIVDDLINNRINWESVRAKYPEQQQTASDKLGKKD